MQLLAFRELGTSKLLTLGFADKSGSTICDVNRIMVLRMETDFWCFSYSVNIMIYLENLIFCNFLFLFFHTNVA